jgi:hypothetical protein
METLLELRKLFGDGVVEIAVQPKDKTGILIGRLDIDGCLELLVGRGVVGEVKVDMGGVGVLLLSLSGIASRLTGPETIVGDGHFDD